MRVAGTAHVADDVRQVSQHEVVVVGLGVQKAGVGQRLHSPLDLLHEAIPHHRAQPLQPTLGALQHRRSRLVIGDVGGAEIDQPLVALHGQIHQHPLHQLVVGRLLPLDQAELPRADRPSDGCVSTSPFSAIPYEILIVFSDSQ